MYRRNDPRLRRTLNQLSQNLESANESAQAGLFSFTQNYVDPCFSSIGQCFHDCTATCFPSREERLRRQRGWSRGRPELNFDFYDDWEEDETDGLLGWGNNDLDRLLAGGSSYGTTGHNHNQPQRERGMNYGKKARRKSAVQPHDGVDPTIIPSSSYFGFLGKLPWKLGGKGLRYKPSAADLTEHPGAGRRYQEEQEPLMEESSEESNRGKRQHKRNRSETAGSAYTTDSFSSRGDIFPSEDEIDDAVPIDDEFTMALERRNTGQISDENSSSRAGSGKRGSRSRLSMRTVSSRSTRSSGRRGRGDSVSGGIDEIPVPTLAELKNEEEELERREEADLERKRSAAQRLAEERGLTVRSISLSLPPMCELSVSNSNCNQ
jgi:hypothetical protein